MNAMLRGRRPAPSTFTEPAQATPAASGLGGAGFGGGARQAGGRPTNARGFASARPVSANALMREAMIASRIERQNRVGDGTVFGKVID
jgi:hypothetical protein